MKPSPNYTIVYAEGDAALIVARYCSSFGKKRLVEWVAEKCMEIGEDVLVIDFDRNSRVVRVNKEQALKIAARYVESLEEKQ